MIRTASVSLIARNRSSSKSFAQVQPLYYTSLESSKREQLLQLKRRVWRHARRRRGSLSFGTPRLSTFLPDSEDDRERGEKRRMRKEVVREDSMMDDLDLGFSPEELEGPLAEDVEAFFFEDSPKMEITAEPNTVEERVQRVLSGQPTDWYNKDHELMELTEGLMDGAGNRYALTLEVSLRAQERELEQLHSPRTPLDSHKPIIEAICDMALEMEAAGGRMSAGAAEASAMEKVARLTKAADRSFLDEINATDIEMIALGVDPSDKDILPVGQRVAGFGDHEGDW